MTPLPDAIRTPHGLTDDLRRGLRQQRLVTLGTINPDGSPQLTILQFLFDDESERLHLPTVRRSRKVQNVLARPEVTALVDLGGGWVSCTGTGRIIEGAEAAALNRAVYQHVLTEAGLATVGQFLEATDDTTIEIAPTKWMSWNVGPISEWFKEHGIDPGNPVDWYKDLTRQ